MLTVSLLRHGKSSWDDPGLDDFERPLAKRGAKAAAAMGAYLAKKGLRPDVVLCSGATRTRATLALALPELGPPLPKVLHLNALYLAAPDAILGCLRKIEGTARHALVIGHNPGLHALALDLIAGGGRDAIAALATEFPTCALAVITFAGKDWKSLKAASGELSLFMTPRRLP